MKTAYVEADTQLVCTAKAVVMELGQFALD